MRRLGAPPPEVFITDFDETMKAALRRRFPGTKQICIFHINKNIALQFKRKWESASYCASHCASQGASHPPS